MKKSKEIGLDFIVDKLTNSIENVVTDDSSVDVDIIGGQGSLTAEEEKAISEFFRQLKLASQKNKKKHRSKAA